MASDVFTDGQQRVTARQWLPGRSVPGVLTDFGPESNRDPTAYGYLTVRDQSSREWSAYLVLPWEWVVYFPDGRGPVRMTEHTFLSRFKPVGV